MPSRFLIKLGRKIENRRNMDFKRERYRIMYVSESMDDLLIGFKFVRKVGKPNI